MNVELTPFEYAMAQSVGTARYRHAVQAGRNPGAGPSSKRLDPSNDIRGAACEYAASIALNLSWRPRIGEIEGGDVGGIIEVRSTVLVSTGRLIVKPRDDDTAPFVLVLVLDRLHYRLAGWVWAHEAKQLRLITEYGDPAHFVSQGKLRGTDQLRQWAHRTLANL